MNIRRDSPEDRDVSVADMLVSMGAPDRSVPPAVRWLASWLPDAEHRLLDRDDLARIDAYDAARGPHELLASVLPLARPVWFEATLAAESGTVVTAGYGAVPASAGLDIGWTCYASAHRRMIGPLGPARVTTQGMQRPDGVNDDVWYELTQAAGVVMRALLLDVGKH
jgi:hypothetical protein